MLYISRNRMMLKCVIGLLCGLVMSLDFIDTRKGTHEIERPYVYNIYRHFFSVYFYISFTSPFLSLFPFPSPSTYLSFHELPSLSLSLFAFTGKLVVRNYLYACTKTIIFHISLPHPSPSFVALNSFYTILDVCYFFNFCSFFIIVLLLFVPSH